MLAKYRSLQTAGTPAAAVPQAAIDSTAPSLLSAREHEVLTLIARGFSYAEIARLKGLSVHTVQTHIKNLYGKLAVHSKSEAVFEATRLGLESQVEAVEVPTEKVTEIRRGKKVTSDRKFFPGYVLAKLAMSDQVYHLVKNTPKVTGFLGSDNKPVPIPDYEAERILGQVQEGVERPKASITFEIGEQVRVSDGPFASFNGTVQDVDEERSRLKVEVSIFGRATPVELEYAQVEKV